MWRACLCLFCLCACSSESSEPDRPAPIAADVAIHADRAWSGEDAISPAVIAVTAGEIVAFGEDITVDAPEVIKLGDATLMPGLIDAHIHLGAAFGREQAVLDQMLAAGITMVRDVGGDPAALADFRDELASEQRSGPALSFCGPIFTAPGGHPVGTIWATLPPFIIEAMSRQVDTESDARDAVREVAGLGVDCIKAALTELLGAPRLDPAVLAAIADEAHALDLQLTVHTDTSQDVLDAAAAGADSFEHGVTIEPASDAAIAALVTLPFAPTIGVIETVAPPLSITPHGADNLMRAIGQGAAPFVGSDAEAVGTDWSFDDYASELIAMQAAGVAPTDVLRAATIAGAEQLGVSATVGSLRAGKQADIIAVAGDALDDVAATQNVIFVMQRGLVR